MKEHRFVREGTGWYIELPEYIEQGGSKGDLQMVSGADTFLDMIAGQEGHVTMLLDTIPFPGSDELLLTELCDPILGGGYYRIESFEGNPVHQDVWLCDVTRFVFGDIPPKIYIRRAK